MAFAVCTSLESITLPESVTEIGDCAFSRCVSLKSVAIPDSVTKIGLRAFAECTSLESITLPESVTEIGEEVFIGCDSLTTIYCTKEQEQMLIDSGLPEQVKRVIKEKVQDKGNTELQLQELLLGELNQMGKKLVKYKKNKLELQPKIFKH